MQVNTQKGQIFILAPILFTVMIGAIGLTYDLGSALVAKNKAQAVIDATALACGKNIKHGVSSTIIKAQDFIVRNGLDPNALVVETTYQGNPSRVKVSYSASIPCFFSRLLGKDNQEINVSCVVHSGEPKVKGLTPLGVSKGEYVIGGNYVIKRGEPGNSNNGALAIGGNGANQWRDNFMYGVQDFEFGIGDEVDTEPGQMIGPTAQAFDYRYNRGTHGETWTNYSEGNSRVLLVAMIDPSAYDLNGRQTTSIVGFAVFFLDSQESDGSLIATYVGPAESSVLGEGQRYAEELYRVE